MEERVRTENEGPCSPTSSVEATSPGCSSDDSIPNADVDRVRRSKVYSLRQSSIINHIQTERRQNEPKQPKPKIKPPPLSKYRRRTANARERTRMQEINDAFEMLRQVIPNYPTDKHNKHTKITTLRLAMNYITALSDLLESDREQEDVASSVSGSEASLSPGHPALIHGPLDSEGECMGP